MYMLLVYLMIVHRSRRSDYKLWLVRPRPAFEKHRLVFFIANNGAICCERAKKLVTAHKNLSALLSVCE